MEDNARTMSSIGHAWIAAENVLVYSSKIKDACGDIDNDPQEVKPGDMTTCSAYDLISEEDRETLRWVREQGGLDAVETQWDNCTQLADAVIYALCPYGLPDGEGKEYIIDELSNRLMPEDMEWLIEVWPRFEDGEPVRFSDDFERYGEESIVSAATMYSDGSFALNFRAYSKGEHVNRPAPKVLDADGAEIRVGDTVYFVDARTFDHEYDEYVVTNIRTKPGLTPIEVNNSHNGYRYGYPKDFTHRAPVLAADGKPLREGETVYHVADGRACIVREVRENGAVVEPMDGRSCCRCRADYLTHERTDSWERLEEDAESLRQTVADQLGDYDFDESGKDSVQTRLMAIVRRARALAERDA